MSRPAILPQAMPEAPPAQPVPAVQTEVEDRSDAISACSAQESELAESAPVEAAPAEVAEGEDQYDDAEDRAELLALCLPQESVFLFGKFAFGKKGG